MFAVDDGERDIYTDHNEKLNAFVVLATEFINDGRTDKDVALSVAMALGTAETQGDIGGGNVAMLAAVAVARLARMMHEADRAPI